MGVFSLNLRRQRGSRPQKLPLYEDLNSSRATKERYASDSSDSEDDHGDNISERSSLSSPHSSRQTSSSYSPTAHMLPKNTVSMSRQHHLFRSSYRLPNKVIRYLCLGMIATILLFIFSLIRASQVENRRIADGKVEKKPPPPAPWESFEFLTRYYGGIRTLVPAAKNVPQYPKVEDEQPYNSSKTLRASRTAGASDELHNSARQIQASKQFADHPQAVLEKESADEINECFLDAKRTLRVPAIRYYDGRPLGFPDSVVGSYDVLSLPEDICFERYGRFGPYGYGYSIRTGGLGIGEHGEMEGANAVWENTPQVDWRDINWADTQQRCYDDNASRFKAPVPRSASPRGFFIGGKAKQASSSERSTWQTRDKSTIHTIHGETSAQVVNASASAAPTKKAGSLPRTAFVVRCWDEFLWKEDDRMNLRSLIAELALVSGGRIDVHLLVQVKNDGKYPIWADDEAYQNRIKEAVPLEFQGIVTLWSQTQMLAVYQGIHDLFTTGPNEPLHGAYRGLQMAMQYFAHNHPEYEHFWQWEMDIRYTGHYYDLISKMESWSKQQPRKGLWERNARFYVPDVHGSWEDFRQMARVHSETGAVTADNIWDGIPGTAKDPQSKPAAQIVWGPVRPVDEKDWFEHEADPLPPTSYEKDRYSWGVGEEADLITLNPLFDPEGTSWGLANDITGYNETDGIGKPPRRAQIITASRMSRRLLITMHRETAYKKHHAFPEMWPATVSLHHGFKAVSVPHPIYVDREWPIEYMARVLNAGKNGAAGGSRTSVFGNREHNLRGLTWFYNSGFGGNLYRRWMGLRVNNDGGEEFEMTADDSKDDSTVPQMRGGEGRMCLPPMLLHPVKDVELPVEMNAPDTVIPESDPSA